MARTPHQGSETVYWNSLPFVLPATGRAMSCIGLFVVVRGIGALILLAGASVCPPIGAAQGAQKAAKSGLGIEVLRDREAYSKLGPKQVERLAQAAMSRWPGEFADMSFLEAQRFNGGGKSHCLSTWRHEPTGLEFVLVPGGSFMMGSAEAELGDADEAHHALTLDPFLVARTECTQRAWTRVAEAIELDASPSCQRGDDLPVEQVSSKDVDAWCEAAGLALPTEAQWEYACRAGTTTRFAIGDNPRQLRRFANVADKSTDFEWRKNWDDGFPNTAPVASFLSTAFGLHDVHGNVWEWCRDPYLSYDLPVSSGTGERVGSSPQRVARGGCYRSGDTDVRCAFRYGLAPDYAFCYLGFRPVRDLPWDGR